MDSRTAEEKINPDLPPALIEGFEQICAGNFSYRLPRSLLKDASDLTAFYFNTVAEEIEHIIQSTKEQEVRLSGILENLSQLLLRVAAGDFSVEAPRDFSGDTADVLAFLVNNTIQELDLYMKAARQKAEADRIQLEALVAERTRELHLLATTDVLTKTFNRRHIIEIADQEISRSGRHGHDLSLAMLDLDHFKSVNDTFGQAAGDTALLMAADAMRSRIRSHDRLGRYGGEEFLLIIPETHIAGALVLAEKIRAAIEKMEIKSGENRIPLSASIGLAQWQMSEPLDSVLTRADAALYRAKDNGRNCVVADK